MEVLEIVAIERDVEHAEGQLAVVAGEQVEDAFGHLVAAAADADECERFAVRLFADGVGEAFHAGGDVFGVEGAWLHEVVQSKLRMPMSRRRCKPGNEIKSAAAWALATACWRVAAPATTASTRPPWVSQMPSAFLRVPA